MLKCLDDKKRRVREVRGGNAKHMVSFSWEEVKVRRNNQPIDWLIDWLIDRCVDLSFDHSVDWLIEMLECFLFSGFLVGAVNKDL